MRALPLLLLVLAACGAPPRSETYTSGDTTYVASRGPGERGQMVLVEEMAIGELEGREEYMFGRIGATAFDSEGGIYLFDTQAPAIRYYDASGSYLRTLGDQGSGPGEYQDVVLGMHVRTDGRLIIRDPRNQRLTLYNPDGTYSDAWRINSGLYTSQALFVDDSDTAYLKIRVGEIRESTPALLRVMPDGVVADTLAEPSIPGEPGEGESGRFLPNKVWTMSSTGAFVVGVSSDYSFEIRHPDGTVTVVTRDWEPIALLPGERQEWEARNEWLRTYQGQFMQYEIPPVPESKPPYQSFQVDADGRVWVRLYAEAVQDPAVEPTEVDERTPPSLSYREPVLFDVFSGDGAYLGRLALPAGNSLEYASGDVIWTYRTGESGQPQMVRHRLEDSPAQ